MSSLLNICTKLLSRYTLQLLAVVILLFCVIYFGLPTLQPFSFDKISIGLNLKPWQSSQIITDNLTTNISSITTTTVTLTTTKTIWVNQTTSTAKTQTPGNESFICDYRSNNDTDAQTNTSFNYHRLNALRPYCDILPTPRNGWTPARRYVESDIVFLIYTGAKFYQNRAMATRDTWLSRVTHKYFLSAIPYPPLPVTVIEGAGENYISNMKKLYVGMQIAYQQHNKTAKFYFLAGCDTFVNVPHLLKRLDDFNHSKALVIGGYPFNHICVKEKNKTSGSISYPSGGAGFFLSAGMMEKMYPQINPFFENHWPTERFPWSDVALNCLAHSLGVQATYVPGFWAFTPQQTIRDHGKAKLLAAPEPNTFHYVPPKSMYILDEFYVFQHIDRMANDGNLEELLKFTRQFVASHYEILRKYRDDCTLPPVKSR